jgi:maleate isomerase
MKLNKVKPKYISKSNPRIGLITLGSDFRIEKDFNNVIYGRDIDLYVNRIHCYNPLTNQTLAKMSDDITDVTKDILPDQKIDCVAYCCSWV